MGLESGPENRSSWAMVTGSSRGIGKATAFALARDGWNVVIHSRSLGPPLHEVLATIEGMGQRAIGVAANLAHENASAELVEEAWNKTGGISAWVHFAGADLLTGPEAKRPFSEKMKLITTVDLWGTMLVCRDVGQRMFDAGRGTIVTMGWDQASTGMEGDSGELFAAIKGGVMSFTRSLAKSLAPKVRVNCIAPGWIKTAWGEQASQVWQDRVFRETPLQRWGLPEDIAEMTRFLVSPSAAYVTGQILNVNGGAVCH
ncbi:MAG: SDR family oxidoreductase [Planctomycetota bacterium]